MIQTVSISSMKVSGRSEDVLVTYSLGSCIGLSLYDPVARVGGLIHCMLPLSRIDPGKAEIEPCKFVDTGVPRLLRAMYDGGADRRRLVACVAGAASLLDPQKRFRIGERNLAVLRKILWKNNILISGEDVGGLRPRTMRLFLATGRTVVQTGSQLRDI